MNQMRETIAAISTASTAAAVGMVRISGKDALLVADKIFKAQSKKSLCESKGYRAHYGNVYDSEGEFDTAVALVFRAPKSYTGEDACEITVHGGLYITKRLLRAALENGARLAEAGEFTKRAFQNGKMSLSQAEAVTSLISARGKEEAKAALAVSEGRLNRESEDIRSKLITLLGEISAYCDYPDEDIVDVSRETLLKTLKIILARLDALLEGFDKGRVISEGVDTAIVGSPNVGKSTIMNLLSGYEKSIVTDIAGTTRDIVEDTVRVGDFTLRLSDTAGIRNTQDVVEAVGVERAKKRMQSAALVLAVFDASRKLNDEDLKLIEETKSANCIAIINKGDLESKIDDSKIKAAFERVVYLSAKSGQGKDEFCAAIEDALSEYKLSPDALILINERQYDCAQRARKEVADALFGAKEGQMPDMLGILLEEALRALSELSGESTTEAVVNEIFSKFCVGK